ncbi:NAD+ synthase (glutamine-hydrolyzing), partial [Lecanoromycetidae sp. Uapishka_2]
MRLIKVATCVLNQWSLDFDGNTTRILESIRISYEQGARIRCGPELEICGYGCLDHYFENDVYEASLECLKKIIEESPDDMDMILDVGLPIKFRDVRYNCRAIIYNKRLVLIRPKIYLANDGNYREMRYFSSWTRKVTAKFILPKVLRDIVGQTECTIGDAIIDTQDTCLAPECCEELFTPASPHIESGLNGATIFFNSSGSHHELRKLETRIQLLLEATRKSKGIYIYANQQGCDGDRLYYDGCAMVMVNGAIVAQSSQFSLNDVEVVTAVVDLDEVSSSRSAPSMGAQAVQALNAPYAREMIQSSLHNKQNMIVDPKDGPTPPLARPRYHSPWEEIAMGPGCYLWDYLRRSGAAGYFIPLSGGIDSCATAVIVFSTCRLVAQAIKDGNEQVIDDCQRITAQDRDWVLSAKAEDICNKVLHTAFLGMEKQSSPDTRARAKELADRIGSYHVSHNIDLVFNAVTAFFTAAMGWTLKFKVHGGDSAQNLALQNIQARLRMVISYLFAQTFPMTRGRKGGGSLLVLGSANVDESLRGYLTKYDCSSADINPIGSISKTDLRSFIDYAAEAFDMPVLNKFLAATPTAELEPITKEYVQSDEVDMGMTYDELSVFGKLRKINKAGPWSAFLKLCADEEWRSKYTPTQIYEKTRRFFHYYAINRHKMTTLTPSYHAEQYSPDDNRFDLRPFLYPPFKYFYNKIERSLADYGPAANEIIKKDPKKD